MHGKSNKKKWSRNWKDFDWKAVEEKCSGLDFSHKADHETQYDVGITEEEFYEYLEWAKENAQEEYDFLFLCSRLMKCGMQPDEIIARLTDLKKL